MFLILHSDPSSPPQPPRTWKGQASRIPNYLELRLQSNQDFRQTTAAASRAIPADSVPDVKTPEKENEPPRKSDPLGSRIEDIRFRQVQEKTGTTKNNHFEPPNRPKPPSASRGPSRNSQPTFYNRGQPRTYLSDRHLRNVDVRELSSRVSHGYQYPSPADQSKGPVKKVPEGFSRPKPPPKASTTSELNYIFTHILITALLKTKFFFRKKPPCGASGSNSNRNST